MPQQITKTTTVYTFVELEEDVKEKVLDRYREWNAGDEWWFENMTDMSEPAEEYTFKAQANDAGIHMSRFYFSGFYNQGDGAGFDGSVDYEEYIRANKLGNKYRCLLRHVERDGGGLSLRSDDRWGFSMRVEDADHFFDAYDDTARAWASSDKAEEQVAELVDEIQQHAIELASDFYQQLEREYEYLTSDEQVIESLDANEILFTEDGNIYN